MPKKESKYVFRSVYSYYQKNFIYELDSSITNGLFFCDTETNASKLINIKFYLNNNNQKYTISVNLDKSNEINFNTIYYYRDFEGLLFDTDINAYWFNNEFKRKDDPEKSYLLSHLKNRITSPSAVDNKLYDGLYFYINSFGHFDKVYISFMFEDLDVSKIT